MSIDYQQADKNFVDYRLGLHPQFPLPFRDGATLNPLGLNIAYIGAAQTFGRFVEHPFPKLLQQPIGAKAINLGFAGVGPKFFLEHQYLIELANSTDAVIIQIMSGRSTQNSKIRYIDGHWKGSSTMIDAQKNEKVYAEDAWERIVSSSSLDEIDFLINQTMSNYIDEYVELLTSIKKPKILLWFSTDSPDRSLNIKQTPLSFNSLAGSYPHFITRNQIEKISVYADHYVEVIAGGGLPQKLFSRSTNELTNRTPGDFRSSSVYNEYYPSPEMHMACAFSLAPVLHKVFAVKSFSGKK